MSDTRSVTVEQVTAVFTEWDRCYQADPDNFSNIDDESPDEYGEGATRFFFKLLDEIG